MKKILISVLVLLISVYSPVGVALAYEYSVLAVGDYEDQYLPNLMFGDANYFDDYLEDELDWETTQYEVEPNPDGTGDDYNPTDRTAIGVSLGDFKDGDNIPQANQSDLLYFMGHGYSDHMVLDDDEVYASDIGSSYDPDTYSSNSAWNMDLEWIILGCCSVANRDDEDGVEWAKTLLGTPCRAHGIYGYMDSSPGTGSDELVAERFFSNACTGDEQSIWSSWINANEDTNNTNWGIIVHKDNRLDHLWGQGDVGSDTEGEPDIYQYQYGDPSEEIFRAVNSNSVTNHVYDLEKSNSVTNNLSCLASYTVKPEELDEDSIVNMFFDDQGELTKRQDSIRNVLLVGSAGSKDEDSDEEDSVINMVHDSKGKQTINNDNNGNILVQESTDSKDEDSNEDSVIDMVYNSEGKLINNKDNNGNLLVQGLAGSRLEINKTSGAVLYSTEFSEGTIDFGTDEAIDKAEQFIQSHGGKPSDAIVSKIRPLEKTFIDVSNDTTGKTETIGYQVEYKRTLNGMMVDGYNGDSIRLRIDKDGVSNYYRLWRDIQGNDDGNIKSNDTERKNIISSEQALDSAKENANKIYTISEEINPTDPELVYFSKSFIHDQQIVEPAWRVKIGDNAYVYVNAYTGEVEEY
ncbi:hypothetical protein Dtox_1839 [Desulfofarcimen acetoxidans DSM 771]|uniref:Uncharacterized protein n=1 Tax=Desulfofarcimen acetoxidans (strain ATCC 49208 / DSM 771 / KCTC 5769 / VKM B-1644 / 5575) TaxID=485916 RepID=C8VXN1_DESAS|nr:DUF6345 domain-containing protein [Desulfofarcimen acetoxidans]ACV62687.1 hypothetical protein Dtox_1839 [Desulfofarcimen acetoxidans DSM 771]